MYIRLVKHTNKYLTICSPYARYAFTSQVLTFGCKKYSFSRVEIKRWTLIVNIFKYYLRGTVVVQSNKATVY